MYINSHGAAVEFFLRLTVGLMKDNRNKVKNRRRVEGTYVASLVALLDAVALVVATDGVLSSSTSM